MCKITTLESINEIIFRLKTAEGHRLQQHVVLGSYYYIRFAIPKLLTHDYADRSVRARQHTTRFIFSVPLATTISRFPFHEIDTFPFFSLTTKPDREMFSTWSAYSLGIFVRNYCHSSVRTKTKRPINRMVIMVNKTAYTSRSNR